MGENVTAHQPTARQLASVRLAYWENETGLRILMFGIGKRGTDRIEGSRNVLEGSRSVHTKFGSGTLKKIPETRQQQRSLEAAGDSALELACTVAARAL